MQTNTGVKYLKCIFFSCDPKKDLIPVKFSIHVNKIIFFKPCNGNN